MDGIGKVRVRFSRSLLENLLHLDLGIWITDASWHEGTQSVELTLEGDVPYGTGELVAPLITHEDRYVWDWGKAS